MADYMLFWMAAGFAVAIGLILITALVYWLARPVRVWRNRRLIEQYGSTFKEARKRR